MKIKGFVDNGTKGVCLLLKQKVTTFGDVKDIQRHRQKEEKENLRVASLLVFDTVNIPLSDQKIFIDRASSSEREYRDISTICIGSRESLHRKDFQKRYPLK